jgi:hypothetical protein
MPKGEQRSNREKKKPKKEKIVAQPKTSVFANPPGKAPSQPAKTK